MYKLIKTSLFSTLLCICYATFADNNIWPNCPTVAALRNTIVEDANSQLNNEHWIGYGHTQFKDQRWLVGIAFIKAEDETIARMKIPLALTGAQSPPLPIKSFSFTKQGCADPSNCVIYYCLYHTSFDSQVVISASINAAYADLRAMPYSNQ